MTYMDSETALSYRTPMSVETIQSQGAEGAKRRLDPWSAGAVAIAALVLLPVVSVIWFAFHPEDNIWPHLLSTTLPRYLGNTVLLMLSVGALTAAIGAGAAWLVVMYRFPGHGWLQWALLLPLAVPAYVGAYALVDFLEYAGPVQTGLRGLMGWQDARDYAFPQIRSRGAAILVLSAALYPYVYLLARAAFLQQSGTTFLAARALGSSAWAAFFKVSLPLARPAIAGGVLLAVMETIADFGTVAYFGVQTFATGIYTSWFSMFDRAAAAQLALCLLSFALLLAMLERAQRGKAKYHDPARRTQSAPPAELKGWQAAAAIVLCGVPVLFGAVLPVVILVTMGLDSEQSLFSPRYLGFMRNSVTLAGVAAVLTVLAAISVGFYRRLRPGRVSQGAAYVARLGYAVPGGVIAVGLLVPFAAFDNALDAWMRETFDISTGLLITGSIWLLVLAYLVRFLAAALGAYEGGQSMVHANMDAAARSLGQTPLGTLRRVHLPILAPSLLTALLIVFVDVMKELPATLIMRPFNYDTLAVQAYRLASDERLNGAAVPSLVIVAMGLLPVILICRQVGRQR